MPRFEVLVPAAPPALPVDVTLRIDADNWLAALKAGLEKIGGPGIASNLLCDIRADGSIHVSDPQGGGVFRIQELAEVPQAQPPAPGRPSTPMGAAAPSPLDDVLAELFERVADLDRQKDRKSGLAFLLDLALEKIDCEAGSVLLARLGGRELEFAVARGPRSQEMLKLRLTVPMGVGVVGFCAQEDVCVAVSDAEEDPRFYRAISEAIGYETRSLLCAPIARGGRVLGALEVVNKRGGGPFAEADLAVLSYLAHQAAELIERLDR